MRGYYVLQSKKNAEKPRITIEAYDYNEERIVNYEGYYMNVSEYPDMYLNHVRGVKYFIVSVTDKYYE